MTEMADHAAKQSLKRGVLGTVEPDALNIDNGITVNGPYGEQWGFDGSQIADVPPEDHEAVSYEGVDRAIGDRAERAEDRHKSINKDIANRTIFGNIIFDSLKSQRILPHNYYRREITVVNQSLVTVWISAEKINPSLGANVPGTNSPPPNCALLGAGASRTFKSRGQFHIYAAAGTLIDWSEEVD